MNWIKVTDRLPTTNALVLYYSPQYGIHLGFYDDEVWYGQEENRLDYDNEFPTHWAIINPPTT